MLILSLYSSAGVTEKHLHAFLASQLLLVIFLHTELADIVARLVIAVVLDVSRRYLSHIAEDVRRIAILILSDAALLYVETREAEHLLAETAELLVRELAHEYLLRIARVAGILRVVLDVVHPLDEKLLGDAERLAELCRVNTSALLVHNHHDVVSGLVIYEELAVTVGDGSA